MRTTSAAWRSLPPTSRCGASCRSQLRWRASAHGCSHMCAPQLRARKPHRRTSLTCASPGCAAQERQAFIMMVVSFGLKVRLRRARCTAARTPPARGAASLFLTREPPRVCRARRRRCPARQSLRVHSVDHFIAIMFSYAQVGRASVRLPEPVGRALAHAAAPRRLRCWCWLTLRRWTCLRWWLRRLPVRAQRRRVRTSGADARCFCAQSCGCSPRSRCMRAPPRRR